MGNGRGATRTVIEIIAATATTARLLGWAVLCQLRPMPGQLVSCSLAEGGSIHPIVWLSCENKLNGALIKEISQPLVP